jgi:hypothetical protein
MISGAVSGPGLGFLIEVPGRASLSLKAEKDTRGFKSLDLFPIKRIKRRSSDVSRFLSFKKGTLPYHTEPGVPIPEPQP